MSLSKPRDQTRTARSGDEHDNHEATAPSSRPIFFFLNRKIQYCLPVPAVVGTVDREKHMLKSAFDCKNIDSTSLNFKIVTKKGLNLSKNIINMQTIKMPDRRLIASLGDGSVN